MQALLSVYSIGETRKELRRTERWLSFLWSKCITSLYLIRSSSTSFPLGKTVEFALPSACWSWPGPVRWVLCSAFSHFSYISSSSFSFLCLSYCLPVCSRVNARKSRKGLQGQISTNTHCLFLCFFQTRKEMETNNLICQLSHLILWCRYVRRVEINFF